MDLLFTLLAWLLPLPLIIGAAWYFTRQHENGLKSTTELLGKKWLNIFSTLLFIGTWLIPWGPIIPLLVVLVALQWIEFEEGSNKHRVIVASLGVVGILLGGFIPSTVPHAPESWGEPLLTENPNAAFYPESEQHVWILTEPDLAAVSVTTARTPWALNPIGGETAIKMLIATTGADKDRLHASIEALNKKSSVNINSDLFELVDIDSESTHHYKRGDIDREMSVTRQQIVMDINLPLISLKADVLTVFEVGWGGEATMLTVIRPGLDDSHDVWAEDVVIEWLESHG